MKRDSILGTMTVALVLCVVCSVIVSSAAVLLRPRQEANKKLDQQRNVLAATGMDIESMTAQEIKSFFSDATRVRPVLVDLSTGETVEGETVGIDLAVYEPKKAAKSSELSQFVMTDGPTPGVSRREKYCVVYEFLKDDQIDLYVLPIYGKGLWSTLYGFLALESDTRTVRGITFYEHKETPGLGGEVDNPNWKRLWPGKRVFDDEGNVDFRIIKGRVAADAADASHLVDGLSGATITSRGVSDSVQYWVGDDGFGKYLKRQRSQ
ncbi:MAG: Na(+)-translocating NADH-quinone reductase subunit C [Pirellulales bacterium]|nr:Na(+)-translocating NADH-quinone reductase subunit C [Pirellulales bacterium]